VFENTQAGAKPATSIHFDVLARRGGLIAAVAPRVAGWITVPSTPGEYGKLAASLSELPRFAPGFLKHKESNMTTHAIADVHNVHIERASELLDAYMAAEDSAMLWGPPGVGKTDVARQRSASQARTVITIHTNLRDTVDFRGVPVPDLTMGTTRWLAPDELPRIDRDGPKGTLLLDEINTAPPQVQAACFQLVLEKQIGEYKLPQGWTVVATGNRVGDRAAAQRMPTALRNRFAHINVSYDIEAWARWASKNNVPAEIVAFVRFRRELFGVLPKGDENEFLTPRSVTRAGKYINAPIGLRQELFGGLIGHPQAAELESFLQLYRSLGTLDGILRDPQGANIPTEPSQRYAVATGLARIVDRKTMPALVDYAARLPREFEVLAVTDATTRDETLKSVKAYGDWAARNASVLA
jgi:AAA domain (dynein-related subfamily)